MLQRPVEVAAALEEHWCGYPGPLTEGLSCGGVGFLGEQADIVGVCEGGLEHLSCLDDMTGEGESVGEPEGAQQEGSFRFLDLVAEVAADQAV
ncbi:hypothetical protein ABT150_48365, partial [Streptomyces mirabilis]|uniref:hypothetical protein n=1 Tax=Streptomyces mirabilis TaxID=68239 RepID=UPI00332CD7D2